MHQLFIAKLKQSKIISNQILLIEADIASASAEAQRERRIITNIRHFESQLYARLIIKPDLPVL